jgi:uncharacterized protein (DUF1697 family)
MNTRISFLRGINVGGHKPIKMEDLRNAFESMGFQKVFTLLASGNVIFDVPKSSSSSLKKKIEEGLKKEFGQEIGIITRTIEEIRELVDSNPFKKIKVTPQTRLYVTFLSEKPKTKLKIPYADSTGAFKILRVTDSEVFSVLVLSPSFHTTELMRIIEKEYGKNVTTRNWNTVVKLTRSG